MKTAICLLLTLSLMIGGIGMISVFAEGELLTTDKTAYGVDEPITVTAVGSGKDWVGIYYPGTQNSVRWVYVEDVGSGTPFDIRTVGVVNDGMPDTLAPGRYIIRLMPDDTTDHALALETVEITIGDVDSIPTVGGDSSRLTIEKTTFAYDEPITVSAIGSGKDWVGIYYPGEPHSIRWEYVEALGSGTPFDVKTDTQDNGSAPEVFPAGEYIIRLMPDDTSDLARAIAWVTVTIEAPSSEKPEAPIAAAYTLKHNTDGFAEGTLSVTLGKDNSATDIIPYWANEGGKLKGYTALAKFKVKGERIEITISKNILIPTGATKLLLYTVNANGETSEEAYEIALPENAAAKDFGEPIVEFQAVSDIHLNASANHTYNLNFKNMLKDVALNSPKSIGIFVAGDIADHGYSDEFRQLESIHASVENAPPYFLAIGNHDFYNGSYKDQLAQFLQYAKLPDGKNPTSSHYDFWLGGYHFVFLGNDFAPVDGVKTTLSPATVKWLDETLAENRSEGKPTFLFLHQSLYDTVAGSLPGQGWDGVSNESGLRATLKKYPEVIMFNGHSHWTLDSERNMYPRSDSLPTIFNTASVAYLWTSYRVTGGENLDGSQGYYVRVYEDKVVVLGRDFISGEWIPSALYAVPYENKGGSPVTPPDTTETPDTTATPDTTKAPTSTDAPVTGDTPNLPSDPSDRDQGSSLGLILGITAAVAAVGIATAAFFIIKKKKKE